MRLLQFTRTSGDPIWFNPQRIVAVEPNGCFTLLTVQKERYLVQEPIEDVIEQLRWSDEPADAEA